MEDKKNQDDTTPKETDTSEETGQKGGQTREESTNTGDAQDPQLDDQEDTM